MATLNGATPVAQVTERTAPVNEPLHPVGNAELTTKVTVPENPFMRVTATVDVPATVARVVIGGADNEKSWKVTETVVDLDKPPLEPVTGTVNGAGAVGQRTAICETIAWTEQPAGGVKPEPTASTILPVKPLIAVKLQLESPVTVARVVTGVQLMLKSMTWNVTVLDGILCDGL